LCRGQLAVETRIDSWTPPSAAREPRHPLGALPGRVGSIGGRPLGEPSVSLTCAPPLSPPHWPFAGANGGRRGEDPSVRICQRGAPGFAVSVGDTTIPGVDEDPRVRWSGRFSRFPRPRKAPAARLRPGSRGPPDAKGFWRAWTACLAGAVIRKSLAQVIFLIPRGRHIVVQ
jgi:hypothetical protein